MPRSLLLRGLGMAYLAGFGSLAVQLDGLIGSRGILPAAEYLRFIGRRLGTGAWTYWQFPTLLWFGASDRALHALCWGGLALAGLVIAGILPGPCLALLWLFYLSLAVVGQEFLNYQWDALLLEAGLLGVLLTPWGLRLGRAADAPGGFAVWLFRWLVFRLMFLSGAVKLTSGDPTWRAWTALEYHYQTQPLPAWTSWYIHQMPPWFHWLSVGFMFYAELIAPFFVFGPRLLRRIGFVSLVLLQLLIAATGNYGFFNLLAIILCLSLLDDRDWAWVAVGWRGKTRIGDRSDEYPSIPSPAASVRDSDPPPATRHSPSVARTIAVGLVGGILVAVTGAQTVETVLPWVLVPMPIQILAQVIEPLRSANPYGLFRVMTTERPEITVEGSDDGANWKPYRFRWKPCELDRAPRFTTPHLPRLDWQMWFAALAGDCRSAPWFLRFQRRLLEGSPAVLGLLRENPFPDRPPRFVRARLARYTFTHWGSKDWWACQELGLFCPPLEYAVHSQDRRTVPPPTEGPADPPLWRSRLRPATVGSEEKPHLEAEPGLGPVVGTGGPGDGAAEVEPVAHRLAEARSDVEVGHAAALLDDVGALPGKDRTGEATVLERPAVHLEGRDQRAVGGGVPQDLVEAH